MGPLQSRPFHEEDKVTGLLTVEFLFKDSPLSFSPQTKPTAGNDHCVQPGNSASLQLSSITPSKPAGIMKTSSSGGAGEQSLTSVEYRKVGPSKATYNPYLPYDDNYITGVPQPSQHQNLLVPPSSRTNSRGRQTTFTEPGSLTAGARDQNNLQTESDSANLTRGRQRTRRLFNTIKRKLSGTRSQSSTFQSEITNGLSSIRSASEQRPESLGGRPGSWLSDTSSVSGLSAISNISSKTFVCEESSLVLEVAETDKHHYYLVPIQVARTGKFKKKGTKLHIFLDHIFVAQHLKFGSICSVCHHRISMRPGKQGYVCRDCGLVTHKPCHIQVESHCEQTTLPSLDLEYYSEEKK